MSAASTFSPEEGREAARHQQDEGQGVAEERQQLGERRALAVAGLVRSELRQPLGGLRRAQARGVERFAKGRIHVCRA